MALELEGKIISKLPVQTGTSARGPWSKQEFVLEYQEGNYPTQGCMNVWGEDKVKDLERFNAGDSVKVSFNLSSREFKERWYTDVRAWRIEPLAAQAAQAPAYGAPGFATPTGAGMSQPSQAPAPAPTDFDAAGADTDDLPF